MRRDRHFGPDDPLFFPQYFNMAVGHLAVIPTPSVLPSHPLAITWYTLLGTDFVFSDGAHAFSGLGKISQEIYKKLRACAQSLMTEYTEKRIVGGIPYSPLDGDFYCETYCTQLNHLLGQLELSSSLLRVFIRFALAQRVLLEFRARIDWRTVYRCRYTALVPQGMPADNVIGALTESLADASLLFSCGVPFWLIRPIEDIHGIDTSQPQTPITLLLGEITVRNSNHIIDLHSRCRWYEQR